MPIEIQQVGDGARTGAVVKQSGAAAEHGFAFGSGRVGETEARSEIGGDVVEVVLPVVADSGGHGKIWAQAEGVFDKSGNDLLDERHMAASLLNRDGLRAVRRVIGEAGERIETLREAVVCETAAADIGDVDTKFELVPAAGIGDEVGAVEVAFGAAQVTLRAASGVGAGDVDAGSLGRTGGGVFVVANEEVQLVQQVRRRNVVVGDVDFVLEGRSVGSGFWEHGASHALVLR